MPEGPLPAEYDLLIYADDDHGPLALQEILLAGCPTIGVRTGAPYIQHGATGIRVNQLPGLSSIPDAQLAANLAAFIKAIEKSHSIDRHSTNVIATKQFDIIRIADEILKTCVDITPILSIHQ